MPQVRRGDLVSFRASSSSLPCLAAQWRRARSRLPVSSPASPSLLRSRRPHGCRTSRRRRPSGLSQSRIRCLSLECRETPSCSTSSFSPLSRLGWSLSRADVRARHLSSGPAARGSRAAPWRPRGRIRRYRERNPTRGRLDQTREIAFYATFWLALTAFAEERDACAPPPTECGDRRRHRGRAGSPGRPRPRHYAVLLGRPLRELITCPTGNCPDPSAEGFPRVRPPGLPLVYVVACFAAAYLLFGPRHRRGLVSALLGVCLVGVSRQPQSEHARWTGSWPGARRSACRTPRAVRGDAGDRCAHHDHGADSCEGFPGFRGSAIAERVLSLSSVSELESSSTVTDRVRENGFALEALSGSPIEGLGWGTSPTAW